MRNLGGSLSPKDFVRFNKTDGVWKMYSLECFTSKLLKLGDCLCEKHQIWNIRVISREEARGIIAGRVNGLTAEEVWSLETPTERELAEESLLINGISSIASGANTRLFCIQQNYSREKAEEGTLGFQPLLI
jgi:hypothetical protein